MLLYLQIWWMREKSSETTFCLNVCSFFAESMGNQLKICILKMKDFSCGFISCSGGGASLRSLQTTNVWSSGLFIH